MASPSTGLLRMASIATCATLAVAQGLMSHAKTADTIRVWKVGSPYRGDTPRTWVPSGLLEASEKLGFRISVEAFPAKVFAPTFLEAVRRNAAPDILVFDNMGVMHGITTELGTFEGIAQEATIRRDLIHVTGAFDELLGPAVGGPTCSRPHRTTKRPGHWRSEHPSVRTAPLGQTFKESWSIWCQSSRRRTSTGTPSLFRRTRILIDFPQSGQNRRKRASGP